MPSLNNTIIAPNNSGAAGTVGVGNGTITDGSGNTWTINDGHIVTNGTVDMSTAGAVELSYDNEQIWMENDRGLWWSKSVPSDKWFPGHGTTVNPTGAGQFFLSPNGNYNLGIINGGTLTLQDGDHVTTPGLNLGNSGLVIEAPPTASLTIKGNSEISASGVAVASVGSLALPRAGITNDGTMTLTDSSLEMGALSGKGIVSASNSSSLVVNSACSGNTIELNSSHLTIGSDQSSATNNPGLQFLAPIVMDNNSTITLNNTQATSETIVHAKPQFSDFYFYDNKALVAHIEVAARSTIYAYDTTSSGVLAGSVLLSENHTAGSLPITSHTG